MNAEGVQLLTNLLKDKFAVEKRKELYSIKLACHWSHPKAPYSDLLGNLTTLGDVEALSYQWQGYGGDKIHNADRMLRRVRLGLATLLHPIATLHSVGSESLPARGVVVAYLAHMLVYVLPPCLLVAIVLQFQIFISDSDLACRHLIASCV